MSQLLLYLCNLLDNLARYRGRTGDIVFHHTTSERLFAEQRVQGPVGWTPRLNFTDAATRVEYREPGNDSPCWLQIRMGGSLSPEAIRTELEARGDLFYLNEIAWSVSREGERDEWEPETILVASVDVASGERALLSALLPWRSERMEIVGNFPPDRISSCKPQLDALVSSLRPFEGTAEVNLP